MGRCGCLYHFAIDTSTSNAYVFYNGNGNTTLDAGDELVVLMAVSSLGTVGGGSFV